MPIFCKINCFVFVQGMCTYHVSPPPSCDIFTLRPSDIWPKLVDIHKCGRVSSQTSHRDISIGLSSCIFGSFGVCCNESIMTSLTTCCLWTEIHILPNELKSTGRSFFPVGVKPFHYGEQRYERLR